MEQLTLGIETSCDETAAAVYSNTRGMLSNVLFSQIALHEVYGGVVPEIASRSHLEKINGIVQLALDNAHVSLNDITTIAVTSKPGLPGSLLVGVSFAKGIAWSLHKNIIGINHLEGHAFSASIENQVPFPHLCITASGGHTSMYLIHDYGVYDVLGQTTDDAAGEAFDKIAKLMGYPYPGGPIIEKLAAEVAFNDFFAFPRAKNKTLDFSFSGLKTAVMYSLVKCGAYDLNTKTFLKEDDLELKQQVASSLLVCVSDIFKQKVKYALELYPHIKALTFVGGVACNKYIKSELKALCDKRNIAFFTPSPRYCTDNAGMIAFVGDYKARKGEFADLSLDIF
jgi:N6-L-threonylcarbamoyladenine synthase